MPDVPRESRGGDYGNGAYFEVGMTFRDKDHFYKQLDAYAVLNGVDVKV